MEMMGWIQPASQLAAGALLAGVWQGLLLAAMVWTSLKLAPRTTASIRFLIWMTLFVTVAFLPVFSIFATSHSAAGASVGGAHHPPQLQLDPRWASGIAALWAVFAFLRLGGLVRSGLRLRSILKRSTPADAAISARLLPQRGPRRALLCISTDIDQPCVIGFFAPRVLIPGWLPEKATAVELDQIVLHELSHLRRFDDWINLFQKVAVACSPLNPVLLWIERRLCDEREEACDESVVCATHAPRQYAACLTNLAEQRLARRSAVLSLGAWGRRSQLASRIETILRGSRGLHPWRERAVMAALVLSTLAGAVKLAGSAPLVAFTSTSRKQPAYQAAVSTVPSGAYHEVVFHPKSAFRGPRLPVDRIADRSIQPTAQPGPRPVNKPSLRRASFPPDLTQAPIQSLVIVTRWQSPIGQRTTVTVIDGVIPISALPAAPSPAGWFVVQL